MGHNPYVQTVRSALKLTPCVRTCSCRLDFLDSSYFKQECVNSTLLWCDFSRLGKLAEFGEYVGRVRAMRGYQVSPWADSHLLTLDKHSKSLLEMLLHNTTRWLTQT